MNVHLRVDYICFKNGLYMLQLCLCQYVVPVTQLVAMKLTVMTKIPRNSISIQLSYTINLSQDQCKYMF